MALIGKSAGFAIRLLTALGVAMLALPAYHISELAYLRANDPQSAYTIKPDDALAVTGTMSARLAADPAFVPGESDLASMRAALVSQPLSPDLLALSGLYRDAKGQNAEAEAFIQAANRVSRRSALAELALIEGASSSGDIGAAIRHYHAALSVHPDLQPSLLPILSAALTYPEVRAALKPYIARPVRWSGAFLSMAAREAGAAELEALLEPVPPALREEAYRPGLAAILHRLALERGSEAAARFAAQLIPGFAPAALSDFGLSEATSDERLGQLAWSFRSSEGIAAELGSDQVLTITAQPLFRGAAASRDLLVQGGANYLFNQRVSFGSEAVKPRLRWTAACVKPGEGKLEPFWDQPVPASSNTVRYRTPVPVPADCSVVRFTLEVAGPDGQMPATVSLSELGFVRQS